jgi:hypothetical protein
VTQPHKPSADDLLLGGGGPKSHSFKTIGESLTGTLLEKDTIHQSDFSTGEKKFYKDGNPVYQVVLTLQTQFRNWEGVAADKRPDTPDDGQRRVFCSPALKSELARAIKAASPGGSKGLPEGSVITIQFVREVPGHGNPKKEYAVQIQLPADVALGGAPAAQPVQQVAQPVQQAPAVQQAPVQTAAGQVQAGQQLTPELLALLQAQLNAGAAPQQ